MDKEGRPPAVPRKRSQNTPKGPPVENRKSLRKSVKSPIFRVGSRVVAKSPRGNKQRTGKIIRWVFFVVFVVVVAAVFQ